MSRQESIEDILAELKGELNGSSARGYAPPQAVKSVVPPEVKKTASTDLHSLLAELNLADTPQQHTPLEALLQKVKEGEFTPSPFTLQIATHHSVISHELHQISAEIDRERQQQELAKKQEQAKLASEWLEQLDWLSGEGIWFEKFAKNYASNLEAAIAYLFS